MISGSGSLPLSETLDVLGPIARSVADARQLAAVLAGPDIADPSTLVLPAACVAALRAPAAPIHSPIAVLDAQAWPATLDSATQLNWQGTLDRLQAAGLEVQTWTPPLLYLLLGWQRIIQRCSRMKPIVITASSLLILGKPCGRWCGTVFWQVG